MNYVQPSLEEGKYYSVHANQEKIVGNDATKGGTIYMYCANKHGEGDSAGFRYKFIDEAGQPIGEARTASLTEWVRVASDYLLKPCDMMPVTPSDIKTNSAVKATMISSKVSTIIATAAAARLQTAAAKGVQTAAPLPEEAYQWFVHGGKTLKMENKNKTLVLNKGSTYGVRFSANKKFIRLVMKDKPTVVYTLTADTAKVLGKTAKPAGNAADAGGGAADAAQRAVATFTKYGMKAEKTEDSTGLVSVSVYLGAAKYASLYVVFKPNGKIDYIDVADSTYLEPDHPGPLFQPSGRSSTVGAPVLIRYLSGTYNNALFKAAEELAAMRKVVTQLHKALVELVAA